MAKQRKTSAQKPSSGKRKGTKVNRQRESLGDELIRLADAGHADFAAGFRQFLKQLGVKGKTKPIGAKKLRARLLRDGMDPSKNEFSRAIIAAREE
jgi:hypothetical protein